MINHHNVLQCRCNIISTIVSTFLMRSQVPCWTQVGSKSVKQRNYLELEARSQLLALKGVEGCAEAPGWD